MEISEFLVAFLSQDSDTARTSGLVECAKAVTKANLGRRLLMHETKAFTVTEVKAFRDTFVTLSSFMQVNNS